MSWASKGQPVYFQVRPVAQSIYPSRIICLSAEAAELLVRLGCNRKIVGVTAFARHPAAIRRKPRVSGFSSVNYRKIDALRPDLIITFSDVQAEAVQQLIRRGYTVLATNPRSLEEILQTIELMGRVVGRERAARLLAQQMRSGLERLVPAPCRPRVYFEEWDEPMITGIGWVSELIERAGGEDIFSELSHQPAAARRVVTSEQVVQRKPEIIFASWCGKKMVRESFARRANWNQIPAVQTGRIYEIPAPDILQPGPGLLRGFKILKKVLGSFDVQ